ncbi:DUF6745 domain-containing protein [Schleiferia thermophila]|jgi:hypothetical protein|uniref:DUF6745 domain-containing protein n=1 Tax=Schleiferia thermophila TaxID=884107 RepID=A0A369A4J2_9FLAO|nr:hypothetical protein [Schleiferia thermophila]KFD39231.1 hypothetical protein AT05_06350 [Schleiferia thermophila str. Yellowstone]RCX03328.1 hypothetical protein DES35_103213 [Schleiferia thermophila]GCD80457.1 hypothetical protein JCM30197_17040 [Schleiferia thermophila]
MKEANELKNLLAFYYSLAELPAPDFVTICDTPKEFHHQVQRAALREDKTLHQFMLAAFRSKVLSDLHRQLTAKHLIEKYHRLFNEKYRAKFVQLKNNRHQIRQILFGQHTSPGISTFVVSDDTFLLTVFESVFSEFIAEFSEQHPLTDMVGLYEELSRNGSSFFSYLTRYEAVILRWPDNFHVTPMGIFHTPDQPCLSWKDQRFYFYNNWPISPEFYENPDRVTKTMVMSEKNVEKRRAYMEILGSKRFAELLDLRVRDQSIDRQGYLVELYQSNQPDDLSGDYIQFVKVICPSTGRAYMLCVPPEIKSALQAVAWTFGKELDEYQPVIET